MAVFVLMVVMMVVVIVMMMVIIVMVVMMMHLVARVEIFLSANAPSSTLDNKTRRRTLAHQPS